jgi:hypothetical protein
MPSTMARIGSSLKLRFRVMGEGFRGWGYGVAF